jgi:hypothetical protein
MRQKITTTKTHIHLNLHAKWFDMIYLGIKKMEYRELSPYWIKIFKKLCSISIFQIKSIIFSNGYAKDRRQFEIELGMIYVGEGKEEWGAEKGVEYFNLELGNILQSNF